MPDPWSTPNIFAEKKSRDRLEVITMMMESFPPPRGQQDVLDVLEMTFLVVFCGEMAVLLMALGPRGSGSSVDSSKFSKIFWGNKEITKPGRVFVFGKLDLNWQ